MEIMILFELIKGIILVLLVELMAGRTRDNVISIKAFAAAIVISSLYYLSNQEQFNWLRSILPFAILGVLTLYGLSIGLNSDLKRYAKSVIAAYIIEIMISFFVGILLGSISWIVNRFVAIQCKNEVICFGWILLVVFVWSKYDKIQKYSENIALSISVICGAFVLFFQQFFQMAVVEKDYSFTKIIVLLLYLTMIFTAFMLLQHNRLTAKQQAIEEDNRQMSQRLHRSKDVLGVVSRVVASEEHIDPKLRKELADFCDDEMNEMQDRTLGVNLIGDTGIELVNVMLQKQMMRCADLNISFDVMIPTPIDGYIQNIGISVTEFMRMLNDLLKNAVKAILSSENEHRELLLIMGDAGADCFEIRLYDSGVPFPPVILEHMGERGNTTDGTGNGLADTIETLAHYHASFAIEPIEPGADIYTKCVHIAFDGRGCGA